MSEFCLLVAGSFEVTFFDVFASSLLGAVFGSFSPDFEAGLDEADCPVEGLTSRLSVNGGASAPLLR